MFLTKYYNQPTIILIDEYDAPIENGFINGFYDNVINFMRKFFWCSTKNKRILKICMYDRNIKSIKRKHI